MLKNRIGSYENEINSVLGQKLEGEEGIRELMKAFHFDDLDYIIKGIHDAGIKFGDWGFLNGKFHIFKNMRYIKYLLSPGKKNFYLGMAKNLLPGKVLQQIFIHLLT